MIPIGFFSMLLCSSIAICSSQFVVSSLLVGEDI